MIHTPETGDQLRQAIQIAESGDWIQLQPGTRYVGPFALPDTLGDVLIRSAGPLLIGRVQASDVALLPLPILACDVNQPVLSAESGVSGWHFDGICFQPFAGVTNGEAIVLQGADDITFDRCIIQAPPTGLKRGIRANGTNITVTRSYIAGVWCPGQDSQAIAAWDGAGPYTITDNYLEAASENILFGGADSSSEANTPSDILIEGNTITKDLAWKGQSRQVKNLLELKAARRVQIRGNTFSHNWTDAQAGWAVLFTPRNQDGTAPWSRVSDVLCEGNTITDTERGFTITGYDDANRSDQTTRIVIRDNQIETQGTAFLVANQAGRVEIYRNRVEMPAESAGDNVLLSLDRGIQWHPGEPLTPAEFAVEHLVLAANDAPGTYIHSSTASGEAALKAHTALYSLSVPVTEPQPTPEPEPVPEPPMPQNEPDTTPPVATMTLDQVGRSSRWTVTVTGEGIAYVGYYVDEHLQAALTQPSIGERTWTARVSVPKGTHVIRVVVEDAHRNAVELRERVTR